MICPGVSPSRIRDVGRNLSHRAVTINRSGGPGQHEVVDEFEAALVEEHIPAVAEVGDRVARIIDAPAGAALRIVEKSTIVKLGGELRIGTAEGVHNGTDKRAAIKPQAR